MHGCNTVVRDVENCVFMGDANGGFAQLMVERIGIRNSGMMDELLYSSKASEMLNCSNQ